MADATSTASGDEDGFEGHGKLEEVVQVECRESGRGLGGGK